MNDSNYIDCPSPALLSQLMNSKQDLPPDVGAHIDACEKCQAELDVLSNSKLLNSYRDIVKNITERKDGSHTASQPIHDLSKNPSPTKNADEDT